MIQDTIFHEAGQRKRIEAGQRDITTRFMDITLRLRSRLNLFILTKKVDDI